jgi:RING finger and CHY zinc finger domain-containing protein 1
MEINIVNKINQIKSRNDISNTIKNKLVLEFTYNQKTKCDHYNRNCQTECHKCNKFYPCRICHDENEDHEIDRFKIENMLCTYCYTVQKCAKNCNNCSKIIAEYYCDICHLFDDNSRIISHCDDCGFCRIGINNHCHKCNMCINKDHFDNHKCIDNYSNDCVICLEDLRTSRDNSVVLPCNHIIHSKCLEEYSKTDYKCPLCKKSIGNMDRVWKQIETYMEKSKMPEEYKNHTCLVFCNDCHTKTTTKFHFMYHQCQECFGWNTDILKTNKT